MLNRYSIRLGVALCTPIPYIRRKGVDVLDTVSWPWAKAWHALMLPTNIVTVSLDIQGMEVGEARNSAVRVLTEMEQRPEFLFFLDYDVLVPSDALVKLLHWAAHRPEHDIYAGVYCHKADHPEPLIYAGDGGGPYWDWTVGDILTTQSHGITACHMGLTLIRTSVFDRIPNTDDNPWFQTINRQVTRLDGRVSFERGTEDIWFCKRLIAEAEGSILIDTSVLAGHEDKSTGKVYGLPAKVGPAARAKWLPSLKKDEPSADRVEADAAGKLLALDLGAGSTRRESADYIVYTTDIRADAKPDYVQDTLQLNFPDGHFDLVCSNHHLEHLGRWDQERAWAEIFRITKPGGLTEHAVPSLDWVAEKIRCGDQDQDTWDAMYGAQEAHGYGRELNSHTFGYTRQIAKALAENAGFTDVTVHDWLTDDTLAYHLIIKGRKPCLTPTNGESTTQTGQLSTTNKEAPETPLLLEYSRLSKATRTLVKGSSNGATTTGSMKKKAAGSVATGTVPSSSASSTTPSKQAGGRVTGNSRPSKNGSGKTRTSRTKVPG